MTGPVVPPGGEELRVSAAGQSALLAMSSGDAALRQALPTWREPGSYTEGITAVRLEDASTAADWFGRYAREGTYATVARAALRGRDLVCWCAPGEPCHGDVLLELANR